MDDPRRLTLRLPPELHDALVERAARERRSLNGQIVHLLSEQTRADEPDSEHPLQEPDGSLRLLRSS